MSANNERPEREVAKRVFAREFNDATFKFVESDDERAPNYALLPTGEKANRVFIAGTLMETEDVGDDNEYWRGRIIDRSGTEDDPDAAATFYAYAGQYQPEAAAVLREVEAPAYVTVVGKPRHYETDEGDVRVSLRPESITVVDADQRNQWIVETAEQTAQRIEAFETGEGHYVEMAHERYGDDVEKYRQGAIASLKTVDGNVSAESTEDPDTDVDAAAD